MRSASQTCFVSFMEILRTIAARPTRKKLRGDSMARSHMQDHTLIAILSGDRADGVRRAKLEGAGIVVRRGAKPVSAIRRSRVVF